MVRWLQLEANPEVLGEYARELVSGEEGGQIDGSSNESTSLATFTDVISTERDVLEAIYGQSWLQDCRGIIIVAPIAALERAYQKVQSPANTTFKDYLFIKQYIDNACGAIAMLHLLGNIVGGGRKEEATRLPTLETTSSSKLIIQYLHTLASPEERGRWLETSRAMATLHGRHCLQGDTEAPALEAETDLHFVALLRDVHNLAILDGRLSHPIILDYAEGDFWDAALSLMSLIFKGADNCCALALSMN